MVIAHLLSSLQIGGQERVALELAALQTRAGHDVTVVSLAPPPDGPLADAFRERNVQVARVSRSGAGNFGVGIDLTLTPRLVAFLRQRRFNVVHTHNRMPLIYGAPAGRVAGAVVVHTRHGPGRGKPREQWLRRAAGRFLHAYVAVSPELATLARQLGDCADTKLSVIENGIDLERFRRDDEARRRTRAALGIPQDAWVVGSVGRLAVEKNYPLLVRAMEPELRKGARLVIVGDGASADAIRAEAAARGVSDAVILPGATSDTAPYYAAFDVFALSSDLEGLPLVSLEAMSAALPVVSTAVGGLPGLITDGQTGYLVPKGDAAALSARFAALRADPAAAAAVGARGQAHARARYAREVMTERYLALYARCGARA
jgi:glycosyltransferase involved in cell wall biosynthesis